MSTHRSFAMVALLLLLMSVGYSQEPDKSKPVLPGPEGQQAFDDLGRYYANKERLPPFAEALDQLQARDAAKRAKAGAYLLALFRQSHADEANGRTPWRQLPYFGGGAQNDARDFRHQLADAFGAKAAGEEVLPAVLWLLNEERVADNQKAGMMALRRIEGPRANAVLKLLLAPHPNVEAATGALAEVSKRKLKDLGPQIVPLCGHYRKSLREAARQTAKDLQLTNIPEYNPAKAFTPGLEKQLQQIAAMVWPQPPMDARWVLVSSGKAKDNQQTAGWLLESGETSLRLLDWFGQEITFAMRDRAIKEIALAETAKTISDLRESKDDRAALEKLSWRGMLTAQFQPPYVTQPEILVGVWAWQKGDRKSAASVLFPCIDEMRDDRWLTEIAHDLFGHMYHQEMLDAFCLRRDYDRTFALARHLSQPVFDDYQYQKRAVKLAEQLPRRMEDFKTFQLPTSAQWQALEKKLTWHEQIKYLAERMRLLNCHQLGQPGGISYRDKQYRHVEGAEKKNVEVINPYVQLLKMKLQVADLPALVPFLADENYMLVYSYWRDFHPGRTLHVASWAVANVVNQVAKRDLADLGAYFEKDAAGQKDHLDKILAWCQANAGKSSAELLLANLREARAWEEFAAAAEELIESKNAKALPILLQRSKDFPKKQGDLAALVYQLNSNQAVEKARSWVESQDTSTRFWASLILLRHGDWAKDEGLKPLAEILAKDDGTHYYPRAMDDLLAAKTKGALQLAADIFKSVHFSTSDNMPAIVHRLFLAGRKEALDFLLAGLDSQDPAGTVSGEYKGKKVRRESTRADRIAAELAAWHTDNWEYPALAPDQDRQAKQKELMAWLRNQFDRIRNHEPPLMRTKVFPLRYAEWQLDAP